MGDVATHKTAQGKQQHTSQHRRQSSTSHSTGDTAAQHTAQGTQQHTSQNRGHSKTTHSTGDTAAHHTAQGKEAQRELCAVCRVCRVLCCCCFYCCFYCCFNCCYCCCHYPVCVCAVLWSCSTPAAHSSTLAHSTHNTQQHTNT